MLWRRYPLAIQPSPHKKRGAPQVSGRWSSLWRDLLEAVDRLQTVTRQRRLHSIAETAGECCSARVYCLASAVAALLAMSPLTLAQSHTYPHVVTRISQALPTSVLTYVI